MSAGVASFELRLIDTSAGSLPCVVRGPVDGLQLLIVPPLFEEMNRTRSLLAGIARRLSLAGIGSWLPDLPATGDSHLPTHAASWPVWRRSVQNLSEIITASTPNTPHLFAVRGGALLVDAAVARSHYLLAPVASGERLLRELLRARLAADQERGSATSMSALESRLSTETVELAGYPINPQLAADLRAAKALPSAVPVRSTSLSDGSDYRFDGPPVWRQTEPAAAETLADAIAADIAAWVKICDSR